MQQQQLTTAFLPNWIDDDQLFQRTAVVIDILRASTTMIHALGNGALDITPCLEIDEARQAAANLRKTNNRVVLGGERGGIRVDGFDLGNSPAEYSREVVNDAKIVFSTTNGTRAIGRCENVAKEILIGGFANLATLCDHLESCPKIALICAGTNGVVSREDVLFAGLVGQQLASRQPDLYWDDCSQLAVDAWNAVANEPLHEALANSHGGRNLGKIGQAADIKIAAAVDSHTILPKFRNGQIFTQV